MLKVVMVEDVAVAAGEAEAVVDGCAEVEEVAVEKTEGEVAEKVEEASVEGAAAEAEKAAEVSAATVEAQAHGEKPKLTFDSLHSAAKTIVAVVKSERLRDLLTMQRRGSQHRGQQERFEKRGGGVATYTRVVVTPVFV
jgi:hypothetical protein